MTKYGSLMVLLAWAGATPANNLVAEFRRENAAAMERMMAAMHSPSTGDIDRDFVSMMTPHHMGAIEMAQLELQYGHNEQLRRIAQEIIITQRQEIDAMSLAIGDVPTSSGGM